MITRKDPREKYERGKGAMLFCPACFGEWSADPNDYFLTKDDHEFRCECGEPLVLARKRTQFEILAK